MHNLVMQLWLEILYLLRSFLVGHVKGSRDVHLSSSAVDFFGTKMLTTTTEDKLELVVKRTLLCYIKKFLKKISIEKTRDVLTLNHNLICV